MNPLLPPEAYQKTIEAFGLDKPLYERVQLYIINFFNKHQKAFYLDSFSSSWAKMMEAYEVEESLSSDQLNNLEEMQWQEMPDSLKLFAYNFCIKNGFCFTGTSI